MVSTKARCALGGRAPCGDDLCYGGTTLCGLEAYVDICQHENDPDDCDECHGEEYDEYGDSEDYP